VRQITIAYFFLAFAFLDLAFFLVFLPDLHPHVLHICQSFHIRSPLGNLPDLDIASAILYILIGKQGESQQKLASFDYVQDRSHIVRPFLPEFSRIGMRGSNDMRQGVSSFCPAVRHRQAEVENPASKGQRD
jgi:hypothetical protein